MENATISNEESLYQQGRFPSIIDTDDMVFEMGKQVLNSLNLEKLIDNINKTNKTLQQENFELKNRYVILEPKVKQLEESNKLYEINNTNLSNKIISLNDEIVDLTVELTTKKTKKTKK